MKDCLTKYVLYTLGRRDGKQTVDLGAFKYTRGIRTIVELPHEGEYCLQL